MDDFMLLTYRNIRPAILSLSLLLLPFFSSSSDRVPFAEPEVRKPTVIKDARVFDGEKVLARVTVVIEDVKITALGENISMPPDAEVIAGEGKTLLPGLIDAHVHVWETAQLRQSLVFGVTAVLGMFPTTLRALKDNQKTK